jgi:hypothetical protein
MRPSIHARRDIKMGAALVGNYRIRVPKGIAFSIDPGEDVNTLSGTLFRKDGKTITPIKNWNGSQLKAGVKFTVEPGFDRYEVVVTATVGADTSLTSTADFDPTPPPQSKKKTALRKNEGIIERLWLFLPLVQKKEE